MHEMSWLVVREIEHCASYCVDVGRRRYSIAPSCTGPIQLPIPTAAFRATINIPVS